MSSSSIDFQNIAIHGRPGRKRVEREQAENKQVKNPALSARSHLVNAHSAERIMEETIWLNLHP
eukprot:scaffold364007_cov34-Prasinocladus_malaysianus.AAC.2